MSPLTADEIQVLDRIVGDAHVVGLGENVHTTGGVSDLKAELFRGLVEHEGFRVLAFESPWLPAESLEHYVQSCDGTTDLAITGLFWVFQNSSTGDLVDWICEWNGEHPDDRVHVVGFDTQQQSEDQDEKRLIAAIDADRAVGPQHARRRGRHLVCDDGAAAAGCHRPRLHRDRRLCVPDLHAVEVCA